MVGLTIAHLGVTLFLLADLGADPFNVMVQGYSESWRQQWGQVSLPMEGLTWLFRCLSLQYFCLPGRVLMLVAGCVILAYGMTIVIKSDAGTGPNDLVAVVISDKTKGKFGIVRLIVDAAIAVTGYVLGGIVGAGTVVCIALVGPVAGFFLPVNEKMVNRIVERLV